MNNLEAALTAFWGSFTNPEKPSVKIPAYTGHVAEHDDMGRRVRPAFPYITYELTRPAYGGGTAMRASVWDRREAATGFRGLTNNILEQIAQRVPEGGLLLSFDGGSVWIRRALNFTQYPAKPDPDDPLIVRALVSLEMQGYVF